MKEILLTKNKLTYVDDEAYETLSHYPWVCYRAGWAKRDPIAARSIFLYGTRFSVYMHRLVAGVPQCFKVKWLNENRLDNTYENLQISDKKGNVYKFTPFTGKSEFDGVKWNGWHGMWEASYFKMTIGFYPNEVDAARAYNVKMKEIYPICGRDRLNTIQIMNKYLKNNGDT